MSFKVDFYDPFNSPKLILLLLVAGWLFGHLINSYRLQPVTAFSKEFTVTTLTLGFVISFILIVKSKFHLLYSNWGLIFSFSGILILLKLVTTPPTTIRAGKIQGVLKNIKSNKKQDSSIN